VSVRLAGDSAYERGRLEVLYNGTWGTVSAQGFTEKAANLVCNMLGIWRFVSPQFQPISHYSFGHFAQQNRI